MKGMFDVAAVCVFLFGSAAWGQQFGPWSVPVNMGPNVNSKCGEQHPQLSKDGLTLYFSSSRGLSPADPCTAALHLWYTQRASLDSPWQTPQPLTILDSPLDSLYEDLSATFTTDGHWVFFQSQRPSDCFPEGGIRQLWAAHRQDKNNNLGWEPPINLGCVLNVGSDDSGPTIFEDVTTGTLYLWFTRDLLSPQIDPAGNGYDIYVSTCTADLSTCNRQQLWSSPNYVPELSSPLRDTRTAIRRRDGLEMIVTSNHAGTIGGLDLWVSTRPTTLDAWSIPINLNQDNVNKGGDPVVNSTLNDGAPALSFDGQTLLFYSNRPGGLGVTDLYMSTRQKVTLAN